MVNTRLKRVMGKFLFSPRNVEKRRGMTEFVYKLAGALPDTVVFGGVLRELSLGKTREFCSDLDMVTRHSRGQIEDFLGDLDWTRNKFGGYRVFAQGWMYDVWSLEDTWAAQAGYIRCADFDDLLRTTFFDIDSAAFHVSTRRLIVSNRHLQAVESKVLGINLPENPSPSAMARRAIRMAMDNELSLSRELAGYVIEHFTSDQPDSLESAYACSLKRLLESSRCQFVRPIVQPDFFPLR